MKRLLLVSIFALFMAGCDTTAVDPTAEAIDQPTTLEQNFNIQLANSTVSLDYPEGWDLNAEFPDLGLVIATTEDLSMQTSIDGNLDPEQVYVELLFLPEGSLTQGSPSAVLQNILDSVEETDATVSNIESRTLNGKIAAYVTIDFDGSTDGIQLVIDSGDAYTAIVVAVADGEIDNYISLIEAIAGSIEYINNPDPVEEATEDAVEAEAIEEVTAEATEE